MSETLVLNNAMLGAIVMMIVGQYFGFYNPELAVHAVDWNVVFMLGCMMAILSCRFPPSNTAAATFQP